MRKMYTESNKGKERKVKESKVKERKLPANPQEEISQQQQKAVLRVKSGDINP